MFAQIFYRLQAELKTVTMFLATHVVNPSSQPFCGYNILNSQHVDYSLLKFLAGLAIAALMD